jgi:lysophospholipase L1-like esterase
MGKRILLLTDSVALPRNKPEVCSHDKTYPELLKSEGHIVQQISMGGATSSDILKQVDYYLSFNPDYIFIQVGIVDCAPRLFTKFELDFYRRVGPIGKMAFKLRKKKNKVFTHTSSFKFNINTIIKKFNTSALFFIGIIPSSEKYEQILPGITKNIKEYNNILALTGKYISNEDFDLNGVMSDGHHLNAYGHQQLFDKIANIID